MRLAILDEPRALFGAPGVVRLWLAGVGAGVMRWLDMLAFSLYAFAETHSPLVVALVAFARMLPLLLLGAFAATWAERFDRRRLLLGCFAAMALMYAGLGALSFAGLMNVPIAGLAAATTGLFWVFEIPVRRTMLAEAAGMRRVNTTMSLEMISAQTTRLLGPAIGGLLVGLSGLHGVFVLGALLLGSGVWLLAGLDRPPPRVAPVVRRSLLRDLADGLRYVRRQRLVAAVVVSTAFFNLWYMPYVSLAPVVAETGLHLTPGQIGIVMGAEGLGAIMGSLWIATLAPAAWYRLAYSLGAALMATGVLAFTLADGPVVAFIGLMVGGFGIAGFSTMQMTLVLTPTPAAMRVRAMGVVMVAIGTAPLGFLLAGALAEALGAAMALTVTATGGLIAMLACMTVWPELRRLEPVPVADQPAGLAGQTGVAPAGSSRVS
jgi:MFS family permease